MRKNEGNLTREEYTEMMGFKKPDENSGWMVMARAMLVAILVFAGTLIFLSGCAPKADAEGPPDEDGLSKALHLLCTLTPQGRAQAVIDLNKSLDDSNVSFGIGCPDDMFQINIQHGDLSGRQSTRLTMEVFYLMGEGEGTI